ncbi:hypothetical protein MRBLMI12_000487 [Microbacterium sp. LMI12-1-1.1]|uniref:hypothetical protein n=1 Tax=Microbacterium sp. LMI12-1-1.1 TaxID=3135225 RepID=UPI00342FAD17
MNTGDPMPLPIWPPDPSPERLALIKEAKLQLDTPIKIYPCPAVPGSPGRTLAFGEPPSHISESVIIRPENVDNVESIRRALDFLLHAPAGSPGAFTHELWLQAVMGSGVKFAYEEAYPNADDIANPYAWNLEAM